MGLKGWLKKLERAARDELVSFELRDGSRYYYDPATPDLFMHWYDCACAGNPPGWPEPPEIVRKLREAKDVRAALEAVVGTSEFFPYDRQTLLNERRLEPISLIAGRDVHDQEVEDLSES